MIISVNITKGGCGKTTTVQALAEIFGKIYGKKVLCCDTDPQCNLTTVSGVNSIVKTKYYDIIPSSLLLAYADVEFNVLGREFILKEKLEPLDYDIILIDTPPALGLLNIMSLTASDKLIIPTECSYLAMIGLDQLFDTIQSVRKHSNTTLDLLGILLVKYNSRANLNIAISNSLERIAAQRNTRVFSSKIRETVKIREAQSQQEPLLDWDSSCSAVSDYLELAQNIVL